MLDLRAEKIDSLRMPTENDLATQPCLICENILQGITFGNRTVRFVPSDSQYLLSEKGNGSRSQRNRVHAS